MRRFILNRSQMKKAIAIAAENGIKVKRETETSLLVSLERAAAFGSALATDRVKFRKENANSVGHVRDMATA